MTTASTHPTVAVVGGGLAGLAAALAAAERGMRVELFEQSTTLGGRASSLIDSETGDWIDCGQHVAMGCCTSLLDFCRRINDGDCFVRYHRLHFIAPDGGRHDFARSRWLPPPLHLLPGLMRLKFLSRRERWAIVTGVVRLLRRRIEDDAVAGLTDHDQTIGAWLRRHGQSDRAIEQFWSPVLVSALAETVDHASLAAASPVLVDGFLASRGASDLLVPRRPLNELFHDAASRRLAELGVTTHLATRVGHIMGDRCRAHAVVLPNGAAQPFEFVIVAVPWRRVRSLFPDDLWAAVPALQGVERIEPGTISTVHLWFDRPITPLPHAVLVGRMGQWVFARGRYLQVVISAAHRLIDCRADELQAKVCEELRAIWPAARDARLLHGRVLTHPAAVFSMQPGVERLRPAQATPVANLFLAGDWTSTGWPATMEGAVRSGRLAVDALLRQQG